MIIDLLDTTTTIYYYTTLYNGLLYSVALLLREKVKTVVEYIVTTYFMSIEKY